MHVRKPFGQRPLKSNMHERRRSRLPRPAAADVMVYRKNVENASYVLVNFYGFFLFPRVLGHGPYSWIPVKGETQTAIDRLIEIFKEF